MPDPEARSQAAEAAAIRRRWITLGEILAVIAVLISGPDPVEQLSASEAPPRPSGPRRRSARRANRRRWCSRPTAGARRLAMTALDPAQAIQSQTIAFPSPLGMRADRDTDRAADRGGLDQGSRQEGAGGRSGGQGVGRSAHAGRDQHAASSAAARPYRRPRSTTSATGARAICSAARRSTCSACRWSSGSPAAGPGPARRYRGEERAR